MIETRIKKIVMVARRDDCRGVLICEMSDECVDMFRELCRICGIEFELQEVKDDSPFGGPDASYQRRREAIENIFTVQGLKMVEGESALPALEQLISEYARLK